MVITLLRVCKAEGTLIIPLWKSSYFWPLLCEDGRHWNTFVHDWVVLPKFKQLFVRGKAKNGLFGVRELSFIVVALRISFKLSERISLSGFCTHDSGCCLKCRLRLLHPLVGVCCYYSLSVCFVIICYRVVVVLCDISLLNRSGLFSVC